MTASPPSTGSCAGGGVVERHEARPVQLDLADLVLGGVDPERVDTVPDQRGPDRGAQGDEVDDVEVPAAGRRGRRVGDPDCSSAGRRSVRRGRACCCSRGSASPRAPRGPAGPRCRMRITSTRYFEASIGKFRPIFPRAALPGMKVSRSQKFGSSFVGVAEKKPPDTETLDRFAAGWSQAEGEPARGPSRSCPRDPGRRGWRNRRPGRPSWCPPGGAVTVIWAVALGRPTASSAVVSKNHLIASLPVPGRSSGTLPRSSLSQPEIKGSEPRHGGPPPRSGCHETGPPHGPTSSRPEHAAALSLHGPRPPGVPEERQESGGQQGLVPERY